MPYTTLVAGTVITASWANASVRDQSVTPFATAAARTSAIASPVTGMLSYRTDGGLFEGYDGASWVAAARYCPMARKSANETINNSAALQNDDHLLWSVAANAIYSMEIHLFYISGTTPDMKVGFTVPASASLTWGGVYYDTSSALTSNGNFATGAALAIGGTSGDAHASLYGTLSTSSTAGTLQMQWAQNAATVSDTVIYAGSWGQLIRIS